MTTTATATYALTTLFTPPSSCQSVTWVSSTCPSSTCESVYNIVRSTETECYPSGWATSATIFSPGLICPSGYTIADQTTSSYGATDAETLATCCPSGFTYAVESDWIEPWWSTEPCVKTSDITTTLTETIMGVTPTTTTTMTYYKPSIHAMPVGLAWQASDLSLTTAITTSASTTGALTSTSTSKSTSKSSSSSSSNNSGLSTGAKAGVGVGVAVGAILIASAIGAFFYLRRKKQDSSEIPYSESAVEIRSMPQTSPTELSGSFPAELQSPKDHTNHAGI